MAFCDFNITLSGKCLATCQSGLFLMLQPTVSMLVNLVNNTAPFSANFPLKENTARYLRLESYLFSRFNTRGPANCVFSFSSKESEQEHLNICLNEFSETQGCSFVARVKNKDCVKNEKQKVCRVLHTLLPYLQMLMRTFEQRLTLLTRRLHLSLHI